jgi:hypothetical protein
MRERIRRTSSSPIAWISFGVRLVVVCSRTRNAYHASPSGSALPSSRAPGKYVFPNSASARNAGTIFCAGGGLALPCLFAAGAERPQERALPRLPAEVLDLSLCRAGRCAAA